MINLGWRQRTNTFKQILLCCIKVISLRSQRSKKLKNECNSSGSTRLCCYGRERKIFFTWNLHQIIHIKPIHQIINLTFSQCPLCKFSQNENRNEFFWKRLSLYSLKDLVIPIVVNSTVNLLTQQFTLKNKKWYIMMKRKILIFRPSKQ